MIDPKSQFVFPDLNKSSEAEFVLAYKIPETLSYFEGHFPQNPVLPAVAILDAGLELLRIHLSKDVEFKEIAHAKFSSPLVPGDDVQISAKRNADASWLFTWEKSGKTAARYQLTFGTECVTPRFREA